MMSDTLLNVMLKDAKQYTNTVYDITPYWKFYQKSFIRHLRKHDVISAYPHRAFSSMSAFLTDNNLKRYNDMMVYVESFVDFNKIKLVVELGCGGGHQMLLLKKKYPHLTILLFDIPPMLYVTEHNISKTDIPFISYLVTRDMKPCDIKNNGGIYIFANWMFPLILYHKVGLFFNSASFQEMEHWVVGNYLSYVNYSASNVFLYECMDNSRLWGVNTVHRDAARVRDKVWLDDYKKGLPYFDLVDFRIDEFPYCFSMWKKKEG